MEGKILRSGSAYVLRYRSDDVDELRKIGACVSGHLKIHYKDYGVNW